MLIRLLSPTNPQHITEAVIEPSKPGLMEYHTPDSERPVQGLKSDVADINDPWSESPHDKAIAFATSSFTGTCPFTSIGITTTHITTTAPHTFNIHPSPFILHPLPHPPDAPSYHSHCPVHNPGYTSQSSPMSQQTPAGCGVLYGTRLRKHLLDQPLH